MAVYNYKKNETHKLKSNNDEVTIDVVSGNGQGGSYLVLKDLQFIGANEKVSVGKASTLTNSTIQVLVTIQDKLEQTNWTGVIVIVSQGGQNTFYNYAEELPADKDIACYYINITMN